MTTPSSRAFSSSSGRIERYRVTEVPPEVHNQIIYLGIRGGELRPFYRQQRTDRNKDAIIAVAYDNDRIVSWGLSEPTIWMNQKRFIMLYTRVPYRRRGYGTAVLNELCRGLAKDGHTIRVYPHDDQSKAFFHHIGISKTEMITRHE